MANRKKNILIPSILSVVILLFLVQNTRVVSMQFLFWELQMSRVVLVLLVALIGFGIGFYTAKRF